MKLKATLVSLAFAAGILASIALAGSPPGHGHPRDGATEATSAQTTPPGESCRPRVALILRGLFSSAASDGSSFTMDVKRANRHGRSLAGTQVSLQVDAATKFRRHGHAVLSDFVAGDRLNVQARACKAGHADRHRGRNRDAQPETLPALLARRVVGRPGPVTDGDGSTGSTSTETETTGATETTGTTETGETTGTTETTP